MTKNYKEGFGPLYFSIPIISYKCNKNKENMELLTKSNGKYSVSIFSRDGEIEIDNNLPKHKNKKNINDGNEYVTPGELRNRNVIRLDSGFISMSMDDVLVNVADQKKKEKKRSWWDKLKNWRNKDKYKYKYKNTVDDVTIETIEKFTVEHGGMSVIEFFENVKTLLSVEEVKDYETIINNYLKEMAKAKSMGQTAIYERMKNSVEVMKLESILQAKKVRILTSQDIINLGTKSEKGIKIDYIKNFGRIVPDEIMEKKVEADTWEIFDNYVVVHFDPENKSSIKTQQEIEDERNKKKDPILFGIIAGSLNLYYIGDWIDELTLDKAIEIINSTNKEDASKEV